MYLQPVIAVGLGWAFLGETPGSGTVAGGMLVLLGTWISEKG